VLTRDKNRTQAFEWHQFQWPWVTSKPYFTVMLFNIKQMYPIDDTKTVARQSLNWRMEFLHPAMWHVVLKSWQWIYQVAAPCNVIGGSGMTFHRIRPNVRHNGILHLVSISTHHGSRNVILYQSPKFYPNRKKCRHVDFEDGVSQPSWIVGIR